MGKAAGVSRRRRKNANPKFRKKSALRKQRNKQLRVVKLPDPDMRLNWDEKRTTAENMLSMGLVGDVNKLLPIPKSYRCMGLPEPDELMPEAEPDVMQQLLDMGKKKQCGGKADKRHVATSLQDEAQRPQAKNFKFGTQLSRFIVLMIEKHGSDFEKMSMDRANRYQYSAGEIKRMVKKFVATPGLRQAYERAKREEAEETE